GAVYFVVLVLFAVSPKTTRLHYRPVQPVPYSHALHVGKLGMDCRYCHTTVETAAFAAVPPTSVCMNCHRGVTPDTEPMKPVRESEATGRPIRWVRVHDLPDYVYFDHRAHVGRGVGCVACHDRVDRMERVYQAKTLSMGWCLDCHRDPAPYLRPVEFVTNMGWTPDEDARALGRRLMEEMNISPSTDCSTCHR
ncbi:MAG TPA: cytochrome c3 family protein, partial [Thermoguttaceae bacterium]|nr:cytochrome c3 family protein [Thermoguttaceae bacterium]